MTDQSQLDASILNDVADALICSDRNGTITRWNRASTALFGFTADEALGQNLDLIIPEHLRGSHWQAFGTAMKSGVTRLQGRPTLTRATHQSGRKLYVEMTFALVEPPGGHARGAVAVARDVTERVEQQRAAARGQAPGA